MITNETMQYFIYRKGWSSIIAWWTLEPDYNEEEIKERFMKSEDWWDFDEKFTLNIWKI